MLYLLFALALLFPVHVPIEDGAVVDVGTVGPGQAFEVAINKVVEEGGIYGEGGYYDYAYSPNPPEGWQVIPSKKQETPLKVVIKAPPNATEGYYLIPIRLEDFIEKLPPVVFYLRVKVIQDVFDAHLYPSSLSVGVDQPARFFIHVKNKGTIGDAFSLSLSCLFEDGRLVKESQEVFYVPPTSEKVIPFEVSFSIRGDYMCYYEVKHLPSGQKEKGTFKVSVRPSLANDLKAMGRGAIILYPFQQLAYSFLGLLSTLV